MKAEAQQQTVADIVQFPIRNVKTVRNERDKIAPVSLITSRRDLPRKGSLTYDIGGYHEAGFVGFTVIGDNPDKIVGIANGYAQAHDSPAMRPLLELLAYYADATVISTDVAVKKYRRVNPIHAEAETMYKFYNHVTKLLYDKSSNNQPIELILVAHSRGGPITSHYYHALEQDLARQRKRDQEPLMDLGPGIFLMTKGLHEQSTQENTRAVGFDFANTLIDAVGGKHGERLDALRKTVDIYRGVAEVQIKSAIKSKWEFPNRVFQELKACEEINPDTHKIRGDVVVFLGENDPLANPKDIVPAKNQSKQEYIEDLSERSAYMHDNYFSQSNSTTGIIIEGANHTYPIFHAEYIAKEATKIITGVKASKVGYRKTGYVALKDLPRLPAGMR